MKDMEASKLVQQIGAAGVVPVIAIDDVDSALGLADALSEGGLPVAEITFRTAAAADVIQKIARERPNVLTGAGTVLNVENLKRAADCGAAFAVAPGFDPEVVGEAVKMGFPFYPGIMTPTDIQAALKLGVTIQKFFPAGAAGGPKMLKSLAAPYAHLNVRFIPTGGVSQSNLGDYLEIGAVLAVGGTWIAKRDAIAGGQWDAIVENCKNAVEVVQRLRPMGAKA
jgi:2-dehydro-3-deoxyphosphogluconate aldolase/(4S)-4-hydroxy-2-oxoglutarate aldolase